MKRWIQIAVAVAGIAIVVVIFDSIRRTAEDDAWARLASALSDGPSVEALESARESARGTTAEPWTAFHLALQLYEVGGPEERQRAHQVASAALAEFPDHATSTLLEPMVAALATYDG